MDDVKILQIIPASDDQGLRTVWERTDSDFPRERRVVCLALVEYVSHRTKPAGLVREVWPMCSHNNGFVDLFDPWDNKGADEG